MLTETKRPRSSPARATALVVAALAVVALAARHRVTSDKEPGSLSPAPPRERLGDKEPGSLSRPTAAAAALREGHPVDVNAATAEELMLLPRIGPRLAERIVEDRGRRGRFGSLDDLSRVSGIGPRTVDGLRSVARAGP